MFFKKKEEEIIEEEVLDFEGLVIQFTPVCIYLYLTKEFHETFNYTCVCLVDLQDRSFEINGNFITTVMNGSEDLPNIIHQYQLDKFNLPIIKIECQ